MLVGREDLRGLVTLLGIIVLISLRARRSLVGHLGGCWSRCVVTAARCSCSPVGAPRLQAAAVVALGLILFAATVAVPTVTVATLPGLGLSPAAGCSPRSARAA